MQLAEVGCFPLPVQRPGPPILVGGHSRRALLRAVELGDGWIASGLSPEEVQAKLQDLLSLCEQYGRDPSTLQAVVSVDTLPGSLSAVGLRVKFGRDYGDQGPASDTPLEAALHQFSRLGVDMVLLRIPAASLAAELAVLEGVISLRP